AAIPRRTQLSRRSRSRCRRCRRKECGRRGDVVPLVRERGRHDGVCLRSTEPRSDPQGGPAQRPPRRPDHTGARPRPVLLREKEERPRIRRVLIGGLLVAVIAVAAGPASSAPAARSTLVSQLALARVATAKYVNNLDRAKADGYQIITQMIPNMGYHYLNPAVKGFDVRKPPILVYEP